MNSAVVCIFVLSIFSIAFRVYARWLSRSVFELDDTRQTPAHTQEDGVDYVPTHRHVLFGHHFSSIAGAAPIVGPAVAVIWGWVPAVLWITLGVVFAGAVHDMGALVLSMRHGGRSIGDVTASVVGPRARADVRARHAAAPADPAPRARGQDGAAAGRARDAQEV